jgi:large repetitive protein
MTRGNARRLGVAALVLGCLMALPGQASADDPAFTVPNATASEGAGKVTFNVSFGDPAGTEGTELNYSVTDVGTAPGDFSGSRSGKVPVGADGKATVEIGVNNDIIDEDDETFTVKVWRTDPEIFDEATGTITDNDGPPSIQAISNPTVAESNTGAVNAEFVITLSSVSTKPVTIQYSTTDGSAKAPADYTAVGTTPPATKNVPAGETSITISVPVIGDTLPEEQENFFLNAFAATPGADSQGEATIVDNDAMPELTIADAQMLENGPPLPPSVTFTVTLSKASSQPVTVRASTSDGSALGAIDYEVKNSELITIEPNNLTQTFLVPIKNDALDEPSETFNVTLSTPVGATIADGAAVGTILDDDNVSALAITDASTDEPTSGTATMTFTVTLAPASKRTVRVNYGTADGTASAPSDYTAASGTLEFAPDQTTKTITVSVQGDTVNEENETLSVSLSSPNGAKFTDAVGQGTIVDKNAPPSLSISDTRGREGEGATFTVTLAGTTLRTVTVGFNTVDSLAKAGSDYSARVGTLSFAPGEKSKTITITILDDTTSEPTEEFFVAIGDPVNAAITKNRGVGSIEASDQVPGPLTDPPKTVAKPATVLVPRMILGPRLVTVGPNGIAKMLVTCQKASPIGCAGTVELERAVKPLLKLGKKTFTVKKGAKGYASIKLTPRALKLLRKNGTLRAKVIVMVKTSAKTMKVSPGIITLKGTKALMKAKPKPAAPPTQVLVDP